MSGPVSGSRWLEPFAYFDPASCSWRTCQGSLLEASGESCTTWPKQGTWDLGFAYEQPTLELLTGASGSSSSPETLLPTPLAYESTPTDEFVEEVREHLDDPHRRLYLLGRKWHAQRTLSLIVTALLPTPQAADGQHGPDYARQESWRETHGSGGDDLTTAVAKLLPTPAARDSRGGNGPNYQRQGGESLPNAMRLLPTPVANPENPGAGGELRAALTHGPSRRNETGIDSMGRPNEGRPSRLLPTPTAQDAA